MGSSSISHIRCLTRVLPLRAADRLTQRLIADVWEEESKEVGSDAHNTFISRVVIDGLLPGRVVFAPIKFEFEYPVS